MCWLHLFFDNMTFCTQVVNAKLCYIVAPKIYYILCKYCISKPRFVEYCVLRYSALWSIERQSTSFEDNTASIFRIKE
jgi:hypothetical protein